MNRGQDLIRRLRQGLEENPYVFRFEKLCKELGERPLSELRALAQKWGVPPQYWNSKHLICASVLPRLYDLTRTDATCDNDTETSLLGYAWNEIPDYLKYIYRYNGKSYCYHLGDLHKIVMIHTGRDPPLDPYRRFTLTPEVQKDILDRVAWLQVSLDTQRFADYENSGRSFLAQMADKPLPEEATPEQVAKQRLVNMWAKMHYPSLTIDALWNTADESLIDRLMDTLFDQAYFGDYALVEGDDYLFAAYEALTDMRKKVIFYISLLWTIYQQAASQGPEQEETFFVSLEETLAQVIADDPMEQDQPVPQVSASTMVEDQPVLVQGRRAALEAFFSGTSQELRENLIDGFERLVPKLTKIFMSVNVHVTGTHFILKLRDLDRTAGFGYLNDFYQSVLPQLPGPPLPSTQTSLGSFALLVQRAEEAIDQGLLDNGQLSALSVELVQFAEFYGL